MKTSPYHFQHFVSWLQMSGDSVLSAMIVCILKLAPFWLFGNLGNFNTQIPSKCSSQLLLISALHLVSPVPCHTWPDERRISMFMCQAHSESFQLVADPLLRMFFLHIHPHASFWSLFKSPSLPTPLPSLFFLMRLTYVLVSLLFLTFRGM